MKRKIVFLRHVDIGPNKWVGWDGKLWPWTWFNGVHRGRAPTAIEAVRASRTLDPRVWAYDSELARLFNLPENVDEQLAQELEGLKPERKL